MLPLRPKDITVRCGTDIAFNYRRNEDVLERNVSAIKCEMWLVLLLQLFCVEYLVVITTYLG